MSLKDLHTEVAGYRAEAARHADEYTDTHAQVSNDPSLTPEGKRDVLEPLHASTSERMAELLKREKAAVRTAKENLERKVFGLSVTASGDPARIVSYRDAQARARELEDGDDAAEMYHSAVRSGDSVLAAALVEKSLARGWSAIRDDYLERNPGTRESLADLEALAKYSENTLAATANYMPPASNFPRPSAGFPQLGGHTTHHAPHNVPDLAETISRWLGA